MSNLTAEIDELNSKELYRENFNHPLRQNVQPNIGRVQQAGKQSYCASYLPTVENYRKVVSLGWKLDLPTLNIFTHLPGKQLSYFTQISGHCHAAIIDIVDSYDYDYLNLPSSGSFYEIGFASVKGVDIEKKPKHQRNATFIELANQLSKVRRIDTALDLIYDNVDTLLTEGKFQDVDLILGSVNLEQLSVDVILGLLTSTLPARTKLTARKKFFIAVEHELKNRDEWEDGLLTGLES